MHSGCLLWEKDLAVYAADISHFPMFQQILTSTQDTVLYLNAICSAQGWMYDRHKFRHTGTGFVVIGVLLCLMETNKDM